ncbi:MAG: transposase [Chloroflexales bacterium]|nr:transposase [Chloroflexales bacterium]
MCLRPLIQAADLSATRADAPLLEAVRFILYGRAGELATNRHDDQETVMLALHLLQISLVYVNTLMIQDVLADPVWLARLTSDDRRGLTPLIYQHVSSYGVFQLDLSPRLALRDTAVA